MRLKLVVAFDMPDKIGNWAVILLRKRRRFLLSTICGSN